MKSSSDLKLDAAVFSFKKLLSEFPKIRVPEFQRPYSWDQDQLEQLWDDIFKAMQEGAQYWLLGNVILSGASESNAELVIDGQQRLTSLTILAAAIRDIAIQQQISVDDPNLSSKLISLAQEVHRDFIAKPIEDYGDDFEPRLVTGAEREWFQSRIQGFPDDANDPESWPGQYDPPLPRVGKKRGGIPNGIPEEQRRYWSAYHHFYRNVADYLSAFEELQDRRQALRELSSFLGGRVLLVATHVPSEDVAYVLFEVINDRGLDLSVADLVKNLLFERSSSKQLLPDAQRAWAKIVDALDYSLITTFLRYRRMLEAGAKITKGSLYANLRTHISEQSKTGLKKYLHDLGNDADRYSEIVLAPDGWSGPSSMSDRLRREVYIFNQFGYLTSHPLLLAGWQTSDSTTWRIELLHVIESFMIKYSTLGGQATNRLETDFPQLASKLRKEGEPALEECKDHLDKILASENISPWERWHDIRPRINVAKGMLMRIEEAYAGDEKPIGSSYEVHVEHIFPQNPSEAWMADVGIDAGCEESLEDAQRMTGKLGNLCLLGERLNKSASNKPFSSKLRTYGSTNFAISGRLKSFDAWGPEQILENSQFYLEQAMRVWGE